MMVDTSVFAHHVEKHVESVMKNSPIGLCQKRITFMNPRPSCPDYVADAKCDHVKMLIPFAGVPIECLVMFQSTQPSCPPDFIFADSRFLVPLEELTILRDWDVRRSDGLLETVKQLMRYFKMKHIRLLENYYHIHEGYASLVSSGTYTEDEVEIFVPSNKHIPISLLIRLHPDFRKVPSAYFKTPDAKKYPLLLLTFFPHDKSNPNKKLYFSKDLECALGLAINFKFPTFVPNLSLGQYVRVIENELSKKAEVVASGYELRKRYVAMFVSRLENCIVEYDMLLFRKLSFMIEEEDYQILIEINIPLIYPVTMPMLTFRSLYHSYQGIPTSVIMNSYPFSPDWPIEHIYEQTITYINGYASLFPQDSVPFQCKLKRF